MNWKQFFLKILVIIWTVAVFAIAYTVDRTLLFLEAGNPGIAAQPYLVLWLYAIASLFLAVGLLVLFWLAVVKVHKSRFLALLMFFPGLFLVFYPVVFRSPFAVLIQSFGISAEPSSRLYLAGAFVAMIGILNLFLPRSSPMPAFDEYSYS